MFTYPIGFNARDNYNDPLDPYSNNVKLYLKGDGANNSTTIVDSSPLSQNVQRSGDTKIRTDQSKYGGSSIYIDGSFDYLQIAETRGSTCFTVECWVYPLNFNGQTNDQNLIAFGDSSGNNIRQTLGPTNTGQLRAYLYNEQYAPTSFSILGGTLSLNTWNHIALTSVGTLNSEISIFANGVKSSANGNIYPNNPILFIGAYPGASTGMSFYIDSLRVTRDVVRYTANFNPETDTYLAY
jgi:hypothetical protein